ncbi:MAG: hypothetical protein GTN49_10090 [candidate division Zixibacteria bacterium]|nr:hypothetical protein [candidate division Zixibacteria bacterium]
MRAITLCGLAISLGFAATAADDVAGDYTAFGTDPHTKHPYSCKVEIKKTGDVYKIRWYFEGYDYGGVGVIKNGLLCVGYAADVGYGVAIYKIEGDGRLDGVFGLPGFKEKGTEKLCKE